MSKPWQCQFCGSKKKNPAPPRPEGASYTVITNLRVEGGRGTRHIHKACNKIECQKQLDAALRALSAKRRAP